MNAELKDQNKVLDSLIGAIYRDHKESIQIESVTFITPKTQSIEKFRLISRKESPFIFKYVTKEHSEYVRNRTGAIIYFDTIDSIIRWLMMEYSNSNGFLLEIESF